MNTLTASILVFITLFFASFSASAKDVHIYRDAKGNIHITNKKYNPADYRLEKTVYFKPWHDLKKSERRSYVAKPRKSDFDGLIKTIANNHGLEPAFVKAVIHIESAFKPTAKSHAGALGLMQLMPATAGMYNFKSDYFNPSKNITTGVKHMKMLLKLYDGDKEMSLAAYNAGQGAVARSGGIPKNGETEYYVPKVMKLYSQYSKRYAG